MCYNLRGEKIMMYLVFGEQELLVNKMIDKLAKSELEEIDDFNLFCLRNLLRFV